MHTTRHHPTATSQTTLPRISGASALAILVATPDITLEELNDDAQAALRYLLQCEIRRARHAEAAGSKFEPKTAREAIEQ